MKKSKGHTHETSTSLLPSFLRTQARDAAAELAAIALRDAASWANAIARVPDAACHPVLGPKKTHRHACNTTLRQGTNQKLRQTITQNHMFTVRAIFLLTLIRRSGPHGSSVETSATPDVDPIVCDRITAVPALVEPSGRAQFVESIVREVRRAFGELVFEPEETSLQFDSIEQSFRVQTGQLQDAQTSSF